jgi:hypothetical protein
MLIPYLRQRSATSSPASPSLSTWPSGCLNHKSQYFRNYYFSEGLCIGIDLITDQRQCSRKAAAEHLMKTGISLYMGELIGNELHTQREANKRGEIYNSRNLTLLRHYARANNMGLSKFLINKI